jgi:hypothetical protein
MDRTRSCHARPRDSLPIHRAPTASPPTAPAVVKPVKWRIVIARHGKHYLYYLKSEESLSGPEVLSRVMDLYSAEEISWATRSWHLFHTPVADTVELELVRSHVL